MNCKQIRSCSYDYIDDIVDKVARSAVESHLSGCAACRLYHETQCRLHQSVTSAVASELAGLRFQPMPIKTERSGADRRPSFGLSVRRMALAVSCFFLLCAAAFRRLLPAFLAGLAFAVQGRLSPVLAAVLMPASSATVVLFSTLATGYLARRKGVF